MDAVARAAVVYLFLLSVFRLTGKRTLAQITTFDLVLLLIVGEAVQQGLTTDDYSLTNAMLIVLTLVGLDILLAFFKQRSQRLERMLEGLPVVLVEHGQLLQERMSQARVDEAEILAAARELRGIERLDQIKYAVLEASGHITIITDGGTALPKRKSRETARNAK